MSTNINRDFPDLEAEHRVKKLALAAAEAYNVGDDEQLERAEVALVVACLSCGLLTVDEFETSGSILYDGIPADDGNTYHHVYVYVDGQTEPVLDITCDYQP